MGCSMKRASIKDVIAEVESGQEPGGYAAVRRQPGPRLLVVEPPGISEREGSGVSKLNSGPPDSSGQAEISTPTKDKRAIERELEKRLKALTPNTRGTLTLSGQDAHKQADLFGGGGNQ